MTRVQCNWNYSVGGVTSDSAVWVHVFSLLGCTRPDRTFGYTQLDGGRYTIERLQIESMSSWSFITDFFYDHRIVILIMSLLFVGKYSDSRLAANASVD